MVQQSTNACRVFCAADQANCLLDLRIRMQPWCVVSTRTVVASMTGNEKAVNRSGQRRSQNKQKSKHQLESSEQTRRQTNKQSGCYQRSILLSTFTQTRIMHQSHQQQKPQLQVRTDLKKRIRSSSLLSATREMDDGDQSISNHLVRLNNRAVLCLLTRQTVDACRLLTEASCIMARIKFQRDATATATLSSSVETIKTVDDGSPSPSIFFFRWTDLSCVYPTHKHLMFQRAVIVDADDDKEEEQQQQQHDDDDDADDDGLHQSYQLCWAVLYNLGLTCHLLACQAGASAEGRQHFARSMELYELLMSNEYLDHVPANSTPIIQLALSYNRGHIYSEFAMHDLAAQCLVYVQRALIQIRLQQPTTNIEETELNLILLKPPSTAGAA